jgi:hypothetical protein
MASSSQFLPIVFRGHSKWESRFHVQNAGGSAQDITVKAYRVGSSAPNASKTYTNVAANASFTVDFMSSDYDGFGSGQGAYGYATVEGSGGNVAVVVDNINSQTTLIQMSYRGFAQAEANTTIVIPLIYAGHSNWAGGVSVINLSSEPTTVTMSYTADPTYYASVGTITKQKSLSANSQVDFTLAELGIPKSFGGARFTSSNSNAKILAVVNAVNYVLPGGVGFSGPAVNPNDTTRVTSKVALPIAFKLGYPDNWSTGLVVYNVGSGNIKTTWVKANSDPNVAGNKFEYTQSGTDGQLTTITSFEGGASSIIPSGFVGSVFIEAQGPGQRIIVLANHTRYGQRLGSQLLGYNY